MNGRRISVLLSAIAALTLSAILPSEAIDREPTQEEIRSALVRGQEAAKRQSRPDSFYVRFGGTGDREAGGFLITKLGSLSVMGAHMALRGLEPTSTDVAQIVQAPTMMVSTTILGDTPSFAVDSYMVLDQGGKTIKPVTVRFDGQADRSAAWPEAPRFKAKVVSSFNYAEFDPTAKTIITVFPAHGGVVTFPVDFAEIQ
jgi:hypothetical protein